jgi:hypothetical protein
MNKNYVLGFVLLAGIGSGAQAADQFFFAIDGGVYFYPGFGGNIGWMHYWKNEKIGFIGDISYYNNGFTGEGDGWKENIKIAHNIGIAAGVVFNNMDMKGIIRTSEYIKLKGLLSIWDKPSFFPKLDTGFNLNVFFTNKNAFSAGVGVEIPIFYPYLSLGMTFTL